MQIFDKNIIENAVKKTENNIKKISDYNNLFLFGGYLDIIYYKLLQYNEIENKDNLFLDYFQKFYSETTKGQTYFNLAGIVGVLMDFKYFI